MTTVDTASIKRIREQTGMSVMACRKALEVAKGDEGKALVFLQKAGVDAAAKKTGRAVGEGVIGVYRHANHRIGAMVEMRCETDFVAKNAAFQGFAHEIAMHIAASAPRYVALEDIPEDVIVELRTVADEETRELDKPASVKEQILAAKLEHYKKRITLLEQPYIKNPDITIGAHVTEAVQKFGEHIRIARFARLEI